MFLKKVVFLSIFCFLLADSVFSQKIFRDGYIVKNNGDYLAGLVEYKYKQDVPSVCVYKRFDIAQEISYLPGEIREFGYIYGNRYKSRTLLGKDSFLEVVVSGDITLYQKGSKYFLEKGTSGLVELINGSIEYYQDGEKRKFDGLAPFLEFITEGKSVINKDKFDLKEDLVPVIANFNKESGSTNIIYNQELSEETLFNELFMADNRRNNFGIYTGVNIYSLTVIPSRNFYISTVDPEIAPIIGFTYERVISSLNNRSNLRIDLMFLKQNFYSYNESTFSMQTKKDDVFFDFTGIKVPVMFQYLFTTGRTRPYFNVGASCMKTIQKNYLHIAELESYSHEIITSEDRDINISPFELTGLIGGGLKIRLNGNLKLNIQGLIEVGPGLLKPEKIVNSFKQYSLQPSIIIGISQ